MASPVPFLLALAALALLPVDELDSVDAPPDARARVGDWFDIPGKFTGAGDAPGPAAHWTIEYDARYLRRIGTIDTFRFMASHECRTYIRGWRAEGDRKPTRFFRVIVDVYR